MNEKACVVMGPAGSGKTTVAKAVSTYLGVPFVDADDHHSPEAKEKMRRGHPLSDRDREPWLAKLRSLMDGHESTLGPMIVACSALKRSYREALGGGSAKVRFVYLEVPRAVLDARLRARTEHFAGPGLLDSQLKTLEAPAPEEALILDGTRSPEDLAEFIAADLLSGGGRNAIP